MLGFCVLVSFVCSWILLDLGLFRFTFSLATVTLRELSVLFLWFLVGLFND